MKKIIMAVAMALASVSAVQAAEFSSLIGWNVDTQRLSPGIGVGTRVNNFGVSYGIVEFQQNNKVTHAHIFSLSKDLYSNGNFAAGVKGGTAYLDREQAANGWVYHYSVYGGYKLAENYRVGVEYLKVRAGTDTLKVTDSDLIVTSFRYKF